MHKYKGYKNNLDSVDIQQFVHYELGSKTSFLILWCSHIANHPHEELVKFGCMLGRK
jgi:hypothetical protein